MSKVEQRDQLAYLAAKELLVAARLDYPDQNDPFNRLIYHLRADGMRKIAKVSYRFADAMLAAREKPRA